MSDTHMTSAEASLIRESISLKDQDTVHVVMVVPGCPMYEVRIEFAPAMLDIVRAGLFRAWRKQLQPPPEIIKRGSELAFAMAEWANSLLLRITEEEEERRMEEPPS